MVTSMMEQSPEELGDLYLDVAEAFMDKGEYGSALPLLSALVCSERYNLAVVWLRHAGTDGFLGFFVPTCNFLAIFFFSSASSSFAQLPEVSFCSTPVFCPASSASNPSSPGL